MAEIKNISSNLNLTAEEKKEVKNCPHEIKDMVKFLKYLKKKSLMEKMKKFKASDGTEVDFDTITSVMARKIQHLPDEEIEKIKGIQRTFQSVKSTMRNTYRAATG
jgi:Ca2+-binding EF-hand superfamily protein